MPPLDAFIAMMGKPKKVIPLIEEMGRIPFLTKMLGDIENAEIDDQWLDIELALILNLGTDDLGVALLDMFDDPNKFIETRAYTHRDVAARGLARKMFGGQSHFFAKTQPSGEWSVKFVWAAGDVTCSSARKFTMPQAITWCVVSALITEARKDED